MKLTQRQSETVLDVLTKASANFKRVAETTENLGTKTAMMIQHQDCDAGIAVIKHHLIAKS